MGGAMAWPADLDIGSGRPQDASRERPICLPHRVVAATKIISVTVNVKLSSAARSDLRAAE